MSGKNREENVGRPVWSLVNRDYRRYLNKKNLHHKELTTNPKSILNQKGLPVTVTERERYREGEVGRERERPAVEQRGEIGARKKLPLLTSSAYRKAAERRGGRWRELEKKLSKREGNINRPGLTFM